MDELIALSNASLQRLPKSIAKPSYARETLTPGIVHIGVGNFHRAHQAWYLHRLMQQGRAKDWAIIGAGVRVYDQAMRTTLAAQDYLTTLIELRPDSMQAEVVGPMIDYLPVEEGNSPLIAKMADPAIRIVSLTVTEGGYYIDATNGGFDENHADIVHDASNIETPRTAFGAIIAALKQRKASGHGPLSILSCDNLQANGTIARQTIVSLAQLSSPDLAHWIAENCTFPNSMVDCIVPATGEKELALARQLGVHDNAPVTHENFRQWVVEDDFCAGRPDWDKVGVTFSQKVDAYEAMKLRMLNAGHQVLANVGEVLSLNTIADCMADPIVHAFFSKVQTLEIMPHVSPVPGMTPATYLDLITTRFSNTSIEDTTRRVAFDGSARHTGFVLPIIRDALTKQQSSINGLALVEALWARMCAGSREDGSSIEPNDPFWSDLHAHAIKAKAHPAAWLEQDNLYGELSNAAPFADAFVRWLSMIWDKGARATLSQYLSNS